MINDRTTNYLRSMLEEKIIRIFGGTYKSSMKELPLSRQTKFQVPNSKFQTAINRYAKNTTTPPKHEPQKNSPTSRNQKARN